jgi:hypothetical protein
MTALLLKTIERIRMFDPQLGFPFAIKIPPDVIVLCICEHGDYLDVLYNGRIFSVHKSSVVMQSGQSRRHYSDA